MGPADESPMRIESISHARYPARSKSRWMLDRAGRAFSQKCGSLSTPMTDSLDGTGILSFLAMSNTNTAA